MKSVSILITVFLLAAATAAHAQPAFGVKAGINAANLTSADNEADPKTRIGAVVGLFVDVPVNDAVSFQPEFLYSMQGAKLTEGGDSATIDLHYVQVPLLARIKLGAGSPAGLLVGPAFGIRTRANFKAGGETQDLNDAVKKWDAGLVTGIGINLGRAVLDARYTWGLTNVDISENPDTIKNRVFSVTAGLRF